MATLMKFEQFSGNSRLSKKIPNSVGKFWVLDDVEPDRWEDGGEPTLDELVFETDLEGLVLQVKGGLDLSKVAGIFKSNAEALKYLKSHYPEAYGMVSD